MLARALLVAAAVLSPAVAQSGLSSLCSTAIPILRQQIMVAETQFSNANMQCYGQCQVTNQVGCVADCNNNLQVLQDACKVEEGVMHAVVASVRYSSGSLYQVTRYQCLPDVCTASDIRVEEDSYKSQFCATAPSNVQSCDVSIEGASHPPTSGLSGGQIFGIVFGVLLVVVLGLSVYWHYRKTGRVSDLVTVEFWRHTFGLGGSAEEGKSMLGGAGTGASAGTGGAGSGAGPNVYQSL